MNDTNNNNVESSQGVPSTGIPTQDTTISVQSSVIPVSETQQVVNEPIVQTVVNEPIVETPQAQTTIVQEQPQIVSEPVVQQLANEPVATQNSVMPQVQVPTEINSVKEESKVEVNLNDNIKFDKFEENSTKKEEKKETEVDEIDEAEMLVHKSNRAVVIILGIFFIILLSAFIYYYVIMTPMNSFLAAISSVKHVLFGPMDDLSKTEVSKVKLDLGFYLDTEQSEFEGTGLERVDYIDNDYLQGIIDLDFEKNNYRVELKADKLLENLEKLGVTKKVTLDKSKRKQNMLDMFIYSYDNKTYLGPIDYINYNDIDNFGTKRIQYDYPIQIDLVESLFGTQEDINSSFNKDTVGAIEKIVFVVVDKVASLIKDEDLSRKIVIKKLNNSSKVLMKSTCVVDHERIGEIYHSALNDFYNNETQTYIDVDGNTQEVNIIDILSIATGYDKQLIKDTIKKLLEREVSTENVIVNYYNGLTGNQTGAWAAEIYINDKYYYEAYGTGDKWYVNMGIVENKGTKDEHIIAELQALLSRDTGEMAGYYSLDNEDTRLAITFDYKSTFDDKGKIVGNDLQLNFYNNETYKEEDEKNQRPFAKLNCDLSIYNNRDDPEEKTNFDVEEEIRRAKALPNLGIQGIPKSTVEGLESIGLMEALYLLKFKENMMSHVEFLLDHLLYNKPGAIDRKNANKETTQSTNTIVTNETTTNEQTNDFKNNTIESNKSVLN